MRNIQKHPESNKTRTNLTVTCQVLTDCQSIHSLTRKASYCQGTESYKGEREENWRWKSIKLAPSSPLNSQTGGWKTRVSFWGNWPWGATWAAPRRERPALKNLRENKKKSLCINPYQSSDQMLVLMETSEKNKFGLCWFACDKAYTSVLFVCLPPMNGTLWRKADRENAVKIRAIMTYWLRVCIAGTAAGLIPVLFHFCLIR